MSECVKLSVYTFLHRSYLFNAKTDQVRMCGVLMPYNVGNIMRVDTLGSKVIKGILLDEILR